MATAFIDGEVRLYDSSFNGRLSKSIECQICQVYAEAANEGSILLRVVPVQQQIGTSICGVMAIANGYHAIRGDDLASTEFNHDQLRCHLASCFEKGHFSPFPMTEPRQSTKERRVSFLNIEVNCRCGKSDSWQDMIGCDGCSKWYHLHCAGLADCVIPDGDWFCQMCS